MNLTRVGEHSVRSGGERHKPALVLLRMASRDAGLWDAVWEPLQRWFRVVQFDLPMPSLAALEQPREVFGSLAAAVRDVMEGLGHRSYSVFGWNGGCHVALRCALDYRGAIERCLLLGPFHAVRDPRQISVGLKLLRALFERGDARLYAYYWYLGGLSPRFAAERFSEVEAWVDRRVAGDRFLAQSPERAMRWMRALRATWLSDAELRSISAETLIFAPTLNQWHAGPTVEMAEALSALIPGAKLWKLEDAGSLILLEEPQRVITLLADFLQKGGK